MQFTLTIDGLTEAKASELATLIEDREPAPVAVALNETDEAANIWNLVAYFADEAEARDCGRHLAALSGRIDCSIAALLDVDWISRSLEGLAPVVAGRFHLFGSHDRARRRAGGISLEIGAGLAFGTGHHGTTLGCLLALDGLLKRTAPRRILDVGCGTGVLALAAAKALRRPAIASDIDPNAVHVTQANAHNNDAGSLIAAITAPGLRHRRIAEAAPYDLIFANILARPLIALAGDLTESLAPAGTLILSGLTLDQERPVRAAYRNRGLIPAGSIRLGNWSTLILAKTKGPRRFHRGHHVGTRSDRSDRIVI